MSDNGGNPFGEDFCEYVHNPLLRQYQAIVRLLQSLRQSQADCNDVECFNPLDPNTSASPLSPLTDQSNSLFTYGTLFLLWISFMAFLFMFRPSSMRKSKSKEPNKDARNEDLSSFNRRRHNFDDDDNSTVS
jgi:hypothetical protein